MDAYIALGYQCNHTCRCCPLTTYDRMNKALEYERLQKQTEQILAGCSVQKEGRNHVVLSGGEPFLNPHIFRVLKTLLENQVHITILTNASCLKQPEQLERLSSVLKEREEYKDYLEIVTAIHSSDNKLHDWMTGCAGSFWDTMEGLDNAVSLGLSVTIKIILSRKNAPGLEKTVQYLDAHFPDSVGIQFCGMDYCGRAKKNADELFLSFQELQSYVETALDYLEQKAVKKRRISILEAPLCMLDVYYWKYYILPPQGETAYVAPNLVWNTEETELAVASRKCNTSYAECQDCAVRKICQGCWESAYRLSDTLLRPVRKN